jgi:hypothetical protein
MPKPTLYLAGYGLQQGIQVAGFQLTYIHVGHETISRYHQYEYPTTMLWSGSANPQELVNQLNRILGSPRTINSEYGNPYQCNFGEIRITRVEGNQVSLEARGSCQRV